MYYVIPLLILAISLPSCHKASYRKDRKIYINQSVPVEHRQSIYEAVDIWNKAKGCILIEVSSKVDTSSSYDIDGVSIIYWLYDFPEEVKNSHAIATVFWKDYTVIESDIRINDEHFDFVDGVKLGHVDLISVMVHEIGHSLGIEHSYNKASVMYPTLGYATERRIPLQEDLDEVRCSQ